MEISSDEAYPRRRSRIGYKTTFIDRLVFITRRFQIIDIRNGPWDEGIHHGLPSVRSTQCRSRKCSPREPYFHAKQHSFLGAFFSRIFSRRLLSFWPRFRSEIIRHLYQRQFLLNCPISIQQRGYLVHFPHRTLLGVAHSLKNPFCTPCNVTN